MAYKYKHCAKERNTWRKAFISNPVFKKDHPPEGFFQWVVCFWYLGLIAAKAVCQLAVNRGIDARQLILVLDSEANSLFDSKANR